MRHNSKTTIVIRRIHAIALVAAGCVLGAANALAHHAFALEFDVTKPVDIQGKVSKVELINPHSWIHVDVVDASGKTVTWMIEGGSPNALVRKGVTKATVPVGTVLKVTGYQARDGSNKAVGRNITFADGRELFFDSAAASSAGGAAK